MLEPMPGDELEDACNAVASHGYDENEFAFQRVVYKQLRSNGLAPFIADVIAAHTPSGIERTYQIDSSLGVGYAWAVEFERDLESGVFGAAG